MTARKIFSVIGLAYLITGCSDNLTSVEPDIYRLADSWGWYEVCYTDFLVAPQGRVFDGSPWAMQPGEYVHSYDIGDHGQTMTVMLCGMQWLQGPPEQYPIGEGGGGGGGGGSIAGAGANVILPCDGSNPDCYKNLIPGDSAVLLGLMDYVRSDDEYCQTLKNDFIGMLNRREVKRGDSRVSSAPEDQHVAQYHPALQWIHLDEKYLNAFRSGNMTSPLQYTNAVAKVFTSIMLHEVAHRHNQPHQGGDIVDGNFNANSPYARFNVNPPDPSTSCIAW